MGLFDLFKKKKPQTKVEVKETTTVPHYDPWDMSGKNSNTDFANAGFLNMLSRKPQPIGKTPDDYPRFVSYALEIHDPVKKHKELLKAGFFQETDVSEVLNTYKVVELKEMMSAHGLVPKGKKADLIDTILQNVDVKKLNLPVMYSVSEKGNAFLQQHADLLKLAGNPYGITYEEYISTKNSSPSHLKFNDIIWSIFNRREMFAVGDYNARSLNTYNRAVFLKNEKNYTESLRFYLRALYYELNDPSRIPPDYQKKRHEYPERHYQVPSDILEAIYEFKECFMPQMIQDCYENTNIPQRLIPHKNFVKLIDDIFAGREIDVKNYLPKGLR